MSQVLCAGSQSPGVIQELAAGMRAEAGPMSCSHTLVSFLFYLFFINYKAIVSLLCNAVLVSAVQKCESAICIHISHPLYSLKDILNDFNSLKGDIPLFF